MEARAEEDLAVHKVAVGATRAVVVARTAGVVAGRTACARTVALYGS